MTFDASNKTRIQPKDPQLAERQWPSGASRRQLLRMGAIGGAGIAAAGLAPRFARVGLGWRRRRSR